MLIEFSVANFRSIKERQTLSLVSGSSSSVRKSKSFATGLRPVPYLLRSAAIYGANGSGKTSFVKAVQFLRSFVIRSARDHDPGTPISNVTPYLLSKETRDAPSELEISFVVDQDIYRLGFRVDANRVWAEWLFYTAKGRKTLTLIDREYNPVTDQYRIEISPTLPGPKAVWKASTRPDALAISTAVGLNSVELKRPIDWLRDKLRVIPSSERLSPNFTAKLAAEQNDERVVQFLSDVGLDLVGLEAEEGDAPPEDMAFLPPALLKLAKSEGRTLRRTRVLCKHIDEDGKEVSLPFKEESDGTRVLVSLAGPWIDVADNGVTIIVDELHNSLHPFALRYLLENYFTSAIGNTGGQLVFTTHDIYSMDDVALHRDQIWFTERRPIGGTILIPLSDYEARSNEPYKTGYLRGRYGGVPVTGSRTVQPRNNSNVNQGEATDTDVVESESE